MVLPFIKMSPKTIIRGPWRACLGRLSSSTDSGLFVTRGFKFQQLAPELVLEAPAASKSGSVPADRNLLLVLGQQEVQQLGHLHQQLLLASRGRVSPSRAGRSRRPRLPGFRSRRRGNTGLHPRKRGGGATTHARPWAGTRTSAPGSVIAFLQEGLAHEGFNAIMFRSSLVLML
jgi:hypothetical protein